MKSVRSAVARHPVRWAVFVFLISVLSGLLFLLRPLGGGGGSSGPNSGTAAQATDRHCGPAALYFVCEADGRRVPLSSLRDLLPRSVNGTTLLEVKKAALRLGFDVEGERTSLGTLRKHVRHPGGYAILHVDGNHFVAVLGTTGGDCIRIADSSRGIRDMNRREFRDAYRWTGAALLLARVDTPEANWQ